ncbi:hypothetical protein MADE_000001021525 [Alteromonas mediterranea DE]|uniref:Uncharacterized protein n=1 Tax=Alteromonas mediterranea (strain DSM 17117 / CIP 110805 / LMG 28347 / Deep ecotype) TaxID=1774373 RepID=T2DMA1_ALTMD|nr:hypothetical protein MADE_000001021525 [Alteromonas mediterranea DE]
MVINKGRIIDFLKMLIKHCEANNMSPLAYEKLGKFKRNSV